MPSATVSRGEGRVATAAAGCTKTRTLEVGSLSPVSAECSPAGCFPRQWDSAAHTQRVPSQVRLEVCLLRHSKASHVDNCSSLSGVLIINQASLDF